MLYLENLPFCIILNSQWIFFVLLAAVIVAVTVLSGNTVVTFNRSSCISWLTKNLMVFSESDVAMPASLLSLSNTVGCFYTQVH